MKNKRFLVLVLVFLLLSGCGKSDNSDDSLILKGIRLDTSVTAEGIIKEIDGGKFVCIVSEDNAVYKAGDEVNIDASSAIIHDRNGNLFVFQAGTTVLQDGEFQEGDILTVTFQSYLYSEEDESYKEICADNIVCTVKD